VLSIGFLTESDREPWEELARGKDTHFGSMRD
jgi:hypothetical protein